MKKVVLILISMMLICPVANSFSIPFTDKNISVKIQKTDKKTTKKESK